jgi:endo-1,4-beta-xylanase
LKVNLRLTVLFTLLICFLFVFSACNGQAPESQPSQPPSSPETPELPPSEPVTPSAAAEDLSAQIAAVNLDDTTALTSLFRISEELDQAQSEGSLYEGEWSALQADLMEKFSDWVDTRAERLGLASLPPPPTGNINWPAPDQTLLEGADERIEQYRQGEATITVVDGSGAPVANAVVRLDMLKHDFLFGGWPSLIPPDFFGQDSTYRDAFARLFNYATIVNFWSIYEPVQGQVAQEYLLGDLKNKCLWAKDRGLTVEAHNLIYIAHPYSVFLMGPPEWIRQLSSAEVEDVLQEHVTNLINALSGLVDYWVALNEPTNTELIEEPLRSWIMALTPAGAEALTLEWAHAADPNVKLIVNDWEFYPEQFHQVLEDIVASGAPFDAIGFQSYMGDQRWTLKKTWDIFELLKDFNVPLQFTELEVGSGAYHGTMQTTPQGEAIQAEYLAAFYTLLFSHPATEAITYTWFSDLDVPNGAPGGLLREDLSPKPAYEELMRLIHQEWWTNAEATTNAQGEAVLRGFYGQYLVTVESGTQKVQMLLHLEAGQDNTLTVQLD